jgi:hypothetical protein
MFAVKGSSAIVTQLLQLLPFGVSSGAFYHREHRTLVTGTVHEAFQGFDCLRIFGAHEL